MKIFDNPFLRLIQYVFLLFFSFNLQQVLSYSWHSSTELWDLEYSESAFIAELNEWSCPLLINPSIKYSQCGGKYIMGGYNIMGGSGTTGSSAYYGNYWTRYYGGIGIPAHNQVNVTYTVYAVDSWDGTTADDHYSTSVDGNMITCWHFSAFAGYGAALCGVSSYKDYTVRAYLTFPHTALDMTLKFTNYLDQLSTDESLGIRDIQINFANVTTPVNSICGVSSLTPLATWPCPCSTINQYMYPPNSGSCFPCHTSCATCSAGSATACLSCYPGYYLSGGQCKQCSSNCLTCSGSATTCTTCNSNWFMVGTTCYPSCDPPLQQYANGPVMSCKTPCPGQFVMWNGSCSATCDYSTTNSKFTFTPAIVNTFKECTYPCSSNEYLYFNGSCLETCPSPLTDLSYSSQELCGYSCSSSDYLYWNGSCLSTCPEPLSKEIQGETSPRQFCWYDCQPDEYLYWNGSCLENCPSPLSGERQGTYEERDFCWYTCQPDEFLYWNGSCKSSCPSPLSTEIQETRQFCWYGCQPDEYLYWNGSCLSACPAPLSEEIQDSMKFCWYPCQPDQFLYWNESCFNTCPEPLSTEIQGTRQFCWYGCQPDEYLYWNGSCISTCPAPLSEETQDSMKFCWYPCQPDEYLYWNQSCLSTCPSPLSEEIQGTMQFCWYGCQPDEYLYWNGSCLSTCPAPLSEETQGTNLPMKYCWYLCQPNEYLYWDESCLSDCPSPLTIETQGTNLPQQFCWYTCQPNEYLYWNGTCSSACPEPLKNSSSHGEWFCEYPCSPTQYLYWNGSCIDDCISPLTPVIEGNPSRQFCYYLCPSDKYLYWDGSCQTSCDFPLVPNIEGSPDRQFCWYLCNTSDYLYWNGTCSSSCDFPLVQSTSNGRNYCNYPCKSTQYLAWNGPCLDSCPHPLDTRIEGDPIKKQFCDYPCSKSEYLYQDGSCKTSCPYPYQSRTKDRYQYCDIIEGGFLKKTFLLAPTEAGATSLVCLVKIMHYIRYLDIEMPPRLEGLVQSQPRNILTLQYGSTLPGEAIDEFGEYSLIPVFQKPGNHSSFFVNYFQTFTSIAIGLFVGFCLHFLEKLSIKQGNKTWQAIFEVLRVIFKWNFCLILLAFNIDFIILFAFLEFDTAERSLGSGLPNFSLATDILMILIGIVFLIGLIYFIRKIYQTSTTKVAPEPSASTVPPQENYLIVTGKWQGFRILYTGFKETTTVARYFYLIYTIRIGLPIVLACCLYHFPMINTTLQVNISITILVFILIVRPIKKKINMIQLILFETLALMMNFCIFLLTAINTYNYDAQNSRVKLGDAVVIGNSLTNLLSLIFLALKLSLELKILIPLLPKMTKHEKYASFAKLFLIIIQQGAMGFESIFEEVTLTSSTRNTHIDQIATVTTETSLKNSPRIKRRGAAFPALSTEGDLQTQGENTFDTYATSTRRLKDMTPGTGRIFNDNASQMSQIDLKGNLSQFGGVGASAITEDPSYLGIQGDMSPALRRGMQKTGARHISKGNSKIFTPERNFEPIFYQNNKSTSPGNNNRHRSNMKKEPYYNYNISGNKNENENQRDEGNYSPSIHPLSVSSAFSLDMSDSSPQMRRSGLGNRRLDRTGTNLLASGTSKIYEEEERGASEVDDQLDRRASRWNYSYHTAVSQNLDRDYNFPIEEDVHSKMQRKGNWQYWKAKGREKKAEKSVFEYSDVTITKK